MCQSHPQSLLRFNLNFLRSYSTSSSNDSDVSPVTDLQSIKSANPLNDGKPMLVYENFLSYKRIIIQENRGKSGIYIITNKQTLDIYIGQAGDLAKRYMDYISPGYISRLNKKGNSIIGRALEKYGYSSFSFTVLEYCSPSDLTEREQYYFDKLNPAYNILKKAGALPRGYTRSEETKQLHSLTKAGILNPLYGKSHSEETKELIRQKALGRIHSEETKTLMATKHGFSIYIYEKCLHAEGVTTTDGFKLLGNFASARRAGAFLGISHSTVRKYLNSGLLHKDRYKFTSSVVEKED